MADWEVTDELWARIRPLLPVVQRRRRHPGRRRLRAWTQAGVWDRLQELLLAELHGLGRIDWSRAAVDASHIRAKRGDDAVGPSPVDRRRPGSRHTPSSMAAACPWRSR